MGSLAVTYIPLLPVQVSRVGSAKRALPLGRLSTAPLCPTRLSLSAGPLSRTTHYYAVSVDPPLPERNASRVISPLPLPAAECEITFDSAHSYLALILRLRAHTCVQHHATRYRYPPAARQAVGPHAICTHHPPIPRHTSPPAVHDSRIYTHTEDMAEEANHGSRIKGGMVRMACHVSPREVW